MADAFTASADEAAAALAGMARARAWLIADGKAGNRAQAEGVLTALGCVWEEKSISPGRLERLLSPYCGVARSERFGHAGSTFAPPWPDIAIAIGRLTIPYVKALRRNAGRRTFTVVLLDPKVSLKSADLFWMPQHDRRRGPNVVTTVTAPHRFSPARLAALRSEPPPPVMAALPRPWVAVLVGGASRAYPFTASDEERLLQALNRVRGLGGGLMITPSRRTSPGLQAALAARLGGGGAWIWDGSGDNPLPAMLAHADHFIVTADSVNMCGEPAATGKPIHVFHPAGGNAKLARFHAALEAHGAARQLPDRPGELESWTYVPLYSAPVIATEIAVRLQRRRRMLGPANASS